MTPYDLSDAAALDQLLAAIAAEDPAPVGWTALPPCYADVPLPGAGCWYRQGPGLAWWRIGRVGWGWYRAIGAEGQYARRK